MTPAIWPREHPAQNRMLWLDVKHSKFGDSLVHELPAKLRPNDLLILNDAATLPASLQGTLCAGAKIELRLLQHLDNGRFIAVLFGAGDWRQRTEDRPAPPKVWSGDTLCFGDGYTLGLSAEHAANEVPVRQAPKPSRLGSSKATNGSVPARTKLLPVRHALRATIESVDSRSTRLVTLRFSVDGAALYQALYQLGKPVQYSYLQRELPMWHIQNAYASRPWAMELPSAGHPLTFSALVALQKRGVGLAYLTHAAGLSATGDSDLDALLPLPERYDIPAATVAQLRATKAQGGRVIAAGTSVVRALESAALEPAGLQAGEGVASLIIREGFKRRVVDGLFTGMHAPQESHYDLLLSFAPRALLQTAYQHAEDLGYLGHEFGDSTLIL